MALSTRNVVETLFNANADGLKQGARSAETGLLNLGSAVARVSALVSTLATGAFAVFTKRAVDAASRAEETQNLFDVSFGSMAASAEDWAQRTQAAVGVNDTTLKEFSGTLFNMLTSMNLTKEGAFDLATGFTQLALDTSSFFNLSFDEAFNKIRSGLAGESEPLKQLGVLVTENTIKQTDFAQAILKTGRELTEAEKVQARAIVINEGLRNAQNDLINTQDSWANQTRLVSEAFVNLQEKLGELITESPTLGKIVALITDTINSMSTSVDDNRDKLVEWVEQGLAKVVEVAAKVLDAIGEIGSAVTKLGELLQLGGKSREWLREQLGDETYEILYGAGEYKSDIDERGKEIEAFGQSLEGLGDRARGLADELRGIVSDDNPFPSLEQDLDSLSGQTLTTTAATRDLKDETDETSTTMSTYNSLVDALGTTLRDAERDTILLTKAERKRLQQLALQANIEKAAKAAAVELVAQQGVQRRTWIDLQKIVEEYDYSLLITAHRMNEVADETESFNDSMQTAASLAQALGGATGDLIGNLASLAAGLKSVFGGAGALTNLKDIFKDASKAAGGGFLGAIAGIGSVAGPIAAIVGPAISLVSSALGKIFDSGPDLVRDAARDLGANITQEMADEIEKSGQPIELAIAKIFKAGGFGSTDRFAEEIGDLFSGVQQGKFGKPEAIAALEESIPLLIAEFGTLGSEGVLQVQRILGASRDMNIEFEGSDDLIAALVSRAKELGVEFSDLDALIKQTFAPDTVETMAEKFGLTNEEIRKMADTLGIDVQTNLERLAASVGLTAAEFKSLGAALESQFGIPAEQLAEFLESSGLSAQELADKLGVDVGDGAKLAAEAQELANQRLAQGVELAQRLADALGQAATNSGNINIPSGGSGGVPGFAHEGIVRASPPHGRLVRVAERRDEAIVNAERLQGGNMGSGEGETTYNVNVTVSGLVVGNKDEVSRTLAPLVVEGLRRNHGGLNTEVKNTRAS